MARESSDRLQSPWCIENDDSCQVHGMTTLMRDVKEHTFVDNAHGRWREPAGTVHVQPRIRPGKTTM